MEQCTEPQEMEVLLQFLAIIVGRGESGSHSIRTFLLSCYSMMSVTCNVRCTCNALVATPLAYCLRGHLIRRGAARQTRHLPEQRRSTGGADEHEDVRALQRAEAYGTHLNGGALLPHGGRRASFKAGETDSEEARG